MQCDKRTVPLSHERGLFMAKTIRDLLKKRAEEYAQIPLFVYWNQEHSSQITVVSKEFEKQVACLGKWFLRQGYQRRKIAIYGENSYDWILAFFAVVCTGNVAVLLDYHLPPEELKKLLLFSGCEAVCFSSDYKDIAEELQDGMEIPFCAFADLHRIALRDNSDGNCLLAPVSSEALAVIAFTSGATGNRKGVMLTHRNLLADWCGVVKQIDGSGKGLLLLPLFHVFGMTDMMAVLLCGGTNYICDSMRHIASDVIAIQPSTVCAVPAMLPILYRAFAKMKNHYGARIICGGAPADYGWKDRFASIHVDLYYGYGMTECSSVVATNSELYDKSDGAMKVLESNEVRIDCPDENGIGEVCVKGPNVMRGYYKMPEETAAVLREGWMHTGDLGRLDEDGFLMITGRKKNLLILPNGENVAPEALERKVMEISGVSECMAYLQNGKVVMEIYAQNSHESTIQDAVYRINETVEASHRIMKVVFRDKPFEKNSVGKIIRK